MRKRETRMTIIGSVLCTVLNIDDCEAFCWSSNCQQSSYTTPPTLPPISFSPTSNANSISTNYKPSFSISIDSSIEITTSNPNTIDFSISTSSPSIKRQEKSSSAPMANALPPPSSPLIEDEAPTIAPTRDLQHEASQQQEVQQQEQQIETSSPTSDLLTANSATKAEFAPAYGGTGGPYKFALMPKSIAHPFFVPAYDGCQARAEKIGNIECLFIGPMEDDPDYQVRIIMELVKNKTVQGISISVSNADILTPAINYAMENGIPVVTFDSDAHQSKRLSYIGTDNEALGEQLAKVLLQLDPTGYQFGKFALVSASGPNLASRVAGFRKKMSSYDAYETPWEEISRDISPTNCKDDIQLALSQMYELAAMPEVRAIIPMGGWPMWNVTGWKEFVTEQRRIGKTLVLINADSMPDQVSLLNKGYSDGLVGQLPYQMGEMSIQALWDVNEGGSVLEETIFGTNLLQVLRVPLILPPLTVDYNYIGNLKYIGILLFVVILIFSFGFAIMSFLHRNTKVIRASQPFFLVMICFGAIILGAVLIPVGIDDEGLSPTQEQTCTSCNVACVSIPWLLVIGFSTIFSALFSKTWRINQVIRNASKFKRVKITVKDVMYPFVLIMFFNLVILITWTIVDPPSYVRQPDRGTDPWNRVIQTYGRCHSDQGVIFVSILFAISVLLLIIALVQAYQARAIKTEFSESKYIGIAVASILQALIVGAPVLILSQTQPRTYYIVVCLLVFITCMVVLLLIMAPKARALISPPPSPPARPNQNRWSKPLASSHVSDGAGTNGLRITKIQSMHIKFTETNNTCAEPNSSNTPSNSSNTQQKRVSYSNDVTNGHSNI